jgi:transcriptional regulator with XRE-family HTH domain
VSDSFGARLRDARLDGSMSQSKLSEASGIPKPTLSRYENDHVLPSLQTAARLARALGVPVATLMGEKHSYEEEFIRTLMLHGVTFSSAADARRAAADVAQLLKRERGSRAG